MGKIQLTKEQKIILDLVKQDNFLSSRFYFTGGTALSSVYLHHRLSDDLDFFSEEKFENQSVFTLMQSWGKQHNFSFQSRFAEVVYIFELEFAKGAKLKVDFGYYPYKRIEKGFSLEKLDVDSKLDIAINKLLVVSQRNDVKDFVDLYFLLKEFTLWDLMEGVKVKFKIKTDPLLVGADFLKVEDFDYLPKMIKPLTLEQLKSFFRQRAKQLAEKSLN